MKDENNYFKLPKELEDYVLTQGVSVTPFDEVYIGGYRLERDVSAPKGEYKLAQPTTLMAIKEHYKKKWKEDSWEGMITCFFVDYNNGWEKTYAKIEIDKLYKDFDWRTFINNISTTRIHGCSHIHFQRALQENGIAFKVLRNDVSQSEYDDWMSVEWNRNNMLTLEHSNVGNY